jgi:hypothetical protein
MGAAAVVGPELAALLAETPAKLRAWRDQAQQLSLMLVPARINGAVSDELHASIEHTCSAIYGEIEMCSATTKSVAETSAAAAAELAPLENALRLVLLEITELSTELYAIHSGVARPELSISSS